MICSGETYPNGMVTGWSSQARWSGWTSGRSSQRGLGSARVVHPAGDQGVDRRPDLLVGQSPEAIGGHRRDDREQPPGQVGPARGAVLVGGVVERLQGAEHGLLGAEVVTPELLQRAAGEQGPGADRVEVVLLV